MTLILVGFQNIGTICGNIYPIHVLHTCVTYMCYIHVLHTAQLEMIAAYSDPAAIKMGVIHHLWQCHAERSVKVILAGWEKGRSDLASNPTRTVLQSSRARVRVRLVRWSTGWSWGPPNSAQCMSDESLSTGSYTRKSSCAYLQVILLKSRWDAVPDGRASTAAVTYWSVLSWQLP